MPNFDVKIRKDHYDIEGLVLACKVEDATPSLWSNTAPPVQPDGTDVRFLDLIQTVVANQPTIVNLSGQDYVYFDRGNSKFYNLLRNTGTWAGLNEWTIAVAGKKGSDSSNNQYIFSIQNVEIARRSSSGNTMYVYNGGSAQAGGDMADGAALVKFQGPTEGRWFENGSSKFSGSCANSTPSGSGSIGRQYSGSNYLDFYMAGIYVWKRVLQTNEIYFLFEYVDPVTSHSLTNWATVTLQPWLDDTSTPPRINPYTGAQHKYYHVAVPTGTIARIQITASIGGVVLPDSGLGGKLFTPSWMEAPLSSPPMTTSPSGWSSIIEVDIKNEGHYTMQLTREDGGSVIVHFDAEII